MTLRKDLQASHVSKFLAPTVKDMTDKCAKNPKKYQSFDVKSALDQATKIIDPTDKKIIDF